MVNMHDMPMGVRPDDLAAWLTGAIKRHSGSDSVVDASTMAVDLLQSFQMIQDNKRVVEGPSMGEIPGLTAAQKLAEKRKYYEAPPVKGDEDGYGIFFTDSSAARALLVTRRASGYWYGTPFKGTTAECMAEIARLVALRAPH